MKIRLADYVADFLAKHGVTDVFSVVGGGAMHLNDALGHHEALQVTYNHHEQACAMAAEAYARINRRIAAVCVTTGPGGTNALTGVVCGYLDSIPMFILSGQVRYDTTARYALKTADAHVRSVGDQEFDITKAASSMTKYAVMLEDPKDIRKVLEKAWYLAVNGRPGPVWVDIPVNFQGMFIETEELESADLSLEKEELPPPVSPKTVLSVLEEIKKAQRPVIYAGYGIRLSGGFEIFRKVADSLGVPVVTYWNAVDLMEDEHPLYVGRGGMMGDRPGNFAVQNADLILCIGTRISIRQVGYNYKSWARCAKVIMVDIDKEEMKKPTIHVEEPVWADAKDFLMHADSLLAERKTPFFFPGEDWRRLCQSWKKKYPVVEERHLEKTLEPVNVYGFMKILSEALPEGASVAVSNGACCVVGNQAFVIKKGTRMTNNNAIASMGYGLPAAIGTCVSIGKKDTVCLEGDGSIMMNLQELQTIITNRLPVKIFLINNNGYHSIRMTQNNLFKGRKKVGVGPESHDLSFPQFELLAKAFGYPYFAIHKNADLSEIIKRALETEGPVFTEVFTDTIQIFEPKSATRRLEDGRLVSPPLEDLAPFLSREELSEIMQIPLWEEE